MSEALYIKLAWVIDDRNFTWCEATVVLNGNDLIKRSARMEKSGSMSVPDTVRQTAVSLAKFELSKWLVDFRGPVEPGVPEGAN